MASPPAGTTPQKQKKKKFLAPLRMENHGNFAIYFWHGMNAPGWFQLLKRNRFRISPACVPQVLTVSLMSGLNSALGALSETVFRRRLATFEPDKDPVFIIGHWRSGTTYLHDLLACDPEFGYPMTYECFMPNHFLLTTPLARFWFNLLLPKTRPQDNMAVGFDKPQEDEFALCNLGLNSPLLTMALPRQGPVDMRYLDLAGLSAQERQTWIDGFLGFIRRVSFRQGNKRLILKSPTHTARLKTLVELFPNARFIYISRNPMSVFPSTVHLWKSMNSTQGLQNPARDDPWMEDFVLDTFMHMFETYEQDRKLIPEGHLAEIRYEELVAEPKAALRDLYDKLSLGDFTRSEAAVDGYLAATRDYQTNDYDLTDEQRRRIMESWAPYFARFGYGRSTERAAA
ncbi:MAG: sulfotransferase [Pirellulales bacterium]|nr:sulfotransferase [Pirellulales bacterium]